MFFWSKKWTFPSSLIESSEAWAITKQVYFRNVRKHRALAFALPYIVIEIPLKVEKGINAWLEKPDRAWNRDVITSVCKRIINVDMIRDDIVLLRYHEPYHKKLAGKWQVLD